MASCRLYIWTRLRGHTRCNRLYFVACCCFVIYLLITRTTFRFSEFRLDSNDEHTVLVNTDVGLANTSLDVSTRFTYKEPYRIFYNRVPKCASTTLFHLFQVLGKKNGFKTYHSKVYAELILNETRQMAFVDWFNNELRGPVIYDRHLHFVNFNSYNSTNPIYINMIRDPLQRLVSSYYFIRNHLQTMFPLSPDRVAMTYDECVARRLPECVRDGRPGYFEVIPFFCGQHRFCNYASEAALSAAKANVERHYALVGVMEELPAFIEALELALPAMFTGAQQVYTQSGSSLFRHLTATSEKVFPNKRTVQFMKMKLKYDYDFYHFIRARFTKTLAELRERNRTQTEPIIV